MTSHFEESTITGTLQMSGSRGDEVEKTRHRGDAVNHPLVHADVNDLRAVLDLLARDGQRRLVIAGLDELGELGRTGDVGALADVQEIGIRPDRQRVQSAQAQIRFDLRRHRAAAGLSPRRQWP